MSNITIYLRNLEILQVNNVIESDFDGMRIIYKGNRSNPVEGKEELIPLLCVNFADYVYEECKEVPNV